MPVLKNSRHELFAQGLAAGSLQEDAFVEAGFSHNPGNASVLAKRGAIIDRVKEIKTSLALRIEKKTSITLERVVAEMGKVAFASLGDYMQVQPDGSVTHDFSKMTPDQWAALQEITIEAYDEGDDNEETGEQSRLVKKIKTKQHSKLQALELLGKHLGAFPQAAPATINNTVNNLQVSVDERSAIASFLGGLASRGGTGEVDSRAVGPSSSRTALELEVSRPPKTNGTKG